MGRNLYISVPDNDTQFYTFINMVINNRNGESSYTNERPSHIGPHNVSYAYNEVNEQFIVVDNKKAEAFINMIKDQFTCLRTYWTALALAAEYNESDKYDAK